MAIRKIFKMATVDEKQVFAQLTRLIFLSKQFKYLTDSRMTEFFLKDLFSKLEPCWKQIVTKTNPEDLGEFIDLDKPIRGKVLWPLSLLSLRKVIQTDCLPRSERKIIFQTDDFLINAELPMTTACMNNDRLKYLFSKHVKPKKRYEIRQMALETAQLAAKTGVKCVIDVGSGLGHLSRALAYGYGLDVIAIETQADLIKRARLWDEELEKTAAKVLNEPEMNLLKKCRPRHIIKTISFESASEDFNQIVGETSGGFGIIGLHPCGNLAPNLLKFFSKCTEAKFLVLASCCYNKMFQCLQKPEFPLSSFLNKDVGIFNADSASWACHAIEATSKRLKNRDYDFLKIHCFRATLEAIIDKEWPQHLQRRLKNVSHYPDLSFEEYCEKALKGLGVSVPEEMLKNDKVQKNLQSWKDVISYHALCTLLAPVTETIFQFDRLLFLVEKGIPCRLQSVFDPEVSPRNCILTSIKDGLFNKMSLKDDDTTSQGTIEEYKEIKQEPENAETNLQEIRKKRYEMVKGIKETITECKEMLKGFDDDSSLGSISNLARRVSCVSSEIDFQCKATWQIIVGLVIIFYMLSTDVCFIFVPPFPNFFRFLHTILVLCHLFIAVIAPFIMQNGAMIGLDKTTRDLYREIIGNKANKIGLLISICSICCLKFQRCSGGTGCGLCFELLLSAMTALAEWIGLFEEGLLETPKLNLVRPLLIASNFFISYLM